MPGQGAPDLARDIYVKAAPFLRRLRGYRNILTFQQWRTLRGLGVIVRRWQETGRGD